MGMLKSMQLSYFKIDNLRWIDRPFDHQYGLYLYVQVFHLLSRTHEDFPRNQPVTLAIANPDCSQQGATTPNHLLYYRSDNSQIDLDFRLTTSMKSFMFSTFAMRCVCIASTFKAYAYNTAISENSFMRSIRPAISDPHTHFTQSPKIFGTSGTLSPFLLFQHIGLAVKCSTF